MTPAGLAPELPATACRPRLRGTAALGAAAALAVGALAGLATGTHPSVPTGAGLGLRTVAYTQGSRNVFDLFDRTVTGGWGSADQGGVYDLSAKSLYSVSKKIGAVAALQPGVSGEAALPISQLDEQVGVAFDVPALPKAGVLYFGVQLRRQANGDCYRVRAAISPSGAMTLHLSQLRNGVETAFGSNVVVPGTVVPGQTVTLQGRVAGSGTLTLSGRAWTASTMPDWQIAAVQTTGVLAARGGVSLWAYNSGASTAAATLRVTQLQGYALTATTTTTPPTSTPAPTSSASKPATSSVAPTSSSTPAPTASSTPVRTATSTVASTVAPTVAPTSSPKPVVSSTASTAPAPAPSSTSSPAPATSSTTAPVAAPVSSSAPAPTTSSTTTAAPAPSSTTPAPTTSSTTAPVPAPVSSTIPAPAPSSSSTPAPVSSSTPAPVSSSTPAPAPSSSSTPAPAPSSSTPAPAPSSSTPAPAPSTSSAAPRPAAAPDASNTGVPSGSVLTAVYGDMKITTPGVVLSNLDVHGFVTIAAPNVTIKNSILRGGAPTTAQTGLVNDYLTTATNFVIQDSELVPENPSVGVDGIKGGNYTALRLNIHGTTDGAKILGDNTTIRDSYIHDLLWWASDPAQGGGATHNDSIQVAGGHNMLITDNTLTGMTTNHGQANSALQVTQGVSDANGMAFTGNYVGGGACSVNVAVQPLKSMSNVVLANNTFNRTSTYKCPMIIDSTVTGTMTQDVWSDTGAQVPVNWRPVS